MGLEEFADERPRKPDSGRPILRNDQNETSCDKTEVPKRCREDMKLSKTQWSIVDSGTYLPSASSVKTLTSGVYVFKQSDFGIVFCESPSRCDDLISFPDSIFDNVEKEVDNFWRLGDNFKRYGFLHRRGYLFYGPAGSGKSCLIQRIMRNIIEKDGLVFICSHNPRISSEALKIFREVEPNREIVCVFEDIDAIIDAWGEAEVLMLLDGENQVDKVINIATTNYPEKLDKRIVARPRRFDRIIKIDMPNDSIRKEYFRNKLEINGEDLDMWTKASDGFSFACLSELVISVKCLGNSFHMSVKRLQELSKKRSSSEFDRNDIGFK